MARLRRLAKWLKFAFILLIYLKVIVAIVLVSIHLDTSSRLTLEKNPELKLELRNQADRIYLLMVELGVTYRALGKAAIHIYGLLGFMPMLFYLSNKILFKRMVRLENNPFYQFVKDFELSETRLKQEIDACLIQLLISQANYLNKLNEIRRETMNFKTVCSLDHRLHSFLRPNLKFLNKQDLEQVRLAKREVAFLDKLASNGCLKPAHRTKAWRQELTRFGCNIQMVLMSLATIGGLIFLSAAQNCAHRALKTNPSLPSHLRKFNLMDRIACMVELFFTTTVTANMAAYPLAVAVSNIRDQLKHLSLLEGKFINYLSHHEPNSRSCRNEDALRLYLEWVLFVRMLRANLDWFGFTLSQYVMTALTLAVSFIEIFRAYTARSSLERGLIIGFAIIAISAINLFLCLNANFHSKCKRLSQKSWSILARLQVQTGHYQDHSRQLVSQHTLLLWRRLNHDSSGVVDWFSCKLFNSLTADYRNMIRLNFWLVSFAILLVSHGL